MRVPALAIASLLVIQSGAMAQTSAPAQKQSDLDPSKGAPQTALDAGSLGAPVTREQGAVMLLRMFDKEAEAKAMSEKDIADVLKPYKDANDIAKESRASVAYALKQGLLKPLLADQFAPKASLTGKQYATAIQIHLGIKKPGADSAAPELATKGGLTTTQAAKLDGKALIKDDLVGISAGTLKTGKTVAIGSVVEGGAAVEAEDASGAPKTREEAMTKVVELAGKEADAKAMSEADIATVLKPYKDAGTITAAARPYVGYALKNKLAEAASADELRPKEVIAPDKTMEWVKRALSAAAE